MINSFSKDDLKYGYTILCCIFKYGCSEYFFLEYFHSLLKIPIGVTKFETAYLEYTSGKMNVTCIQ